ncbi:DMT family transporter [Paenirhodobacter populi]|uniref:DMT family transporter n=1 Tax=Paenirhodobacter populi TaxID=2306993 RepID=A0A451GCE4_9RHOB|nr:DMT family transporter [Sinirhodobacter populi]RWR12952.1 DMT family transporter [Sinirhodobacter populi]
MSPVETQSDAGGPAAAPSLVAPPVPPSRLGLAVLLLLGALAFFTLMDAAAKHLGNSYHPAQLIWARFAINLAIVGLMYRGSFLPLFRTRQPGLQLARGVMQVITITLFFIALQTIGLAEADALFDINPVLIALGAALFLGERIGPRRAVAIAISFVGAMVILRPGMGAMELGAVFAFASAFSYAAGNLLTRAVRSDSIATSVIWSAAVGTVMASVVLPFVWKEVAFVDMPYFLAIGVLGTIGQFLVIRAFSLTEASVLAPFGYFSLLFSGFWGWLFFGQLPDRWTVAGALVIVGAGIYVWYRERKST